MNIEITTLKSAKEATGGWADTSKLGTNSASLSAFSCKTGSILAKIEGSVCAGCYARKGMYRFKNVKAALKIREEKISNPLWVEAWVFILRNKKKITESKIFRWHDSGDLQSEEHLEKIIEVARQTPGIRHWLPTKESSFVKNYKGDIPSNIVIRLSGTMVNGKAPIFRNTSTVVTDAALATCRAFETGGQCGECRKCYDPTVSNVAYLKH